MFRSPHVVTTSASVKVWRPFADFSRDYNVEKTLGEGSYGKALLVRNRKTGKLFTCKQLHEVDDDTSTEIDLLISVSGMSPFLCRYFDRFITHVDDDPSRQIYNIMMEYVDGEDLEAYVRRQKGKKPWTSRLVYNFLVSGLMALKLLHTKNIAHRDVKPRNFIVTPSPNGRHGWPFLTLIDFGLGVRLDDKRIAPDVDAGTPAFLSPELVAKVRETYERLGSDESEEARRGDFSATPPTPPPKHLLYKADIWALGASIYFCVTGEHIAPSNSWDSPALYDTFDAIEAFELPPRRTLSLAVPTSHASSTPTAPANAHADDDRSAAGRVRRPVRRFDASPGVVDGDATSPAAAAPAAGSTRARRSRHEPRTPVLFGEHIALDNCLRACLAPSAALRPTAAALLSRLRKEYRSEKGADDDLKAAEAATTTTSSMQDRDENEIVSDDAEPDEYSDDDGDDVDVDDEEVEDDDEDVDDDEEDEEDEEDEDEEEAESQAGSDEHDDDALPSHEVSPNETRTRLRQREPTSNGVRANKRRKSVTYARTTTTSSITPVARRSAQQRAATQAPVAAAKRVVELRSKRRDRLPASLTPRTLRHRPLTSARSGGKRTSRRAHDNDENDNDDENAAQVIVGDDEDDDDNEAARAARNRHIHRALRTRPPRSRSSQVIVTPDEDDDDDHDDDDDGEEEYNEVSRRSRSRTAAKAPPAAPVRVRQQRRPVPPAVVIVDEDESVARRTRQQSSPSLMRSTRNRRAEAEDDDDDDDDDDRSDTGAAESQSYNLRSRDVSDVSFNRRR